MKVLAIASLVSVLLVTLSGCAADTSDDEEGTAPDVGNTGSEEAALVAGRKLPASEIATLLRQAGFPEREVGPMVCTAKWESGWRDRSTNKNRNGSTDYGLFQINSVHLGDSGCPSSASSLFDTARNTQCAYSIWKRQGRNAWYGYQHHRSECQSYPAP